MARISETARLRIPELPTDIDQDSPLEQQVAYVFTAMNLYAKANNWLPTTRHDRPGRQGKVTLTYLVGQLFPNASKEERAITQQIVSSVLRRTGAAECVDRPGPHDRERGEKPTWWVAEDMPHNLIVVATHHKSGQADRLAYVENRLTPREAGEDREPAPVSITQSTPEPSKAERDMIVDDEFLGDIYEQVATCPVPITIPELMVLTDKPSWAVRHALDKLHAAGRVTYRTETREEKRVRGGGKLPPAKHSRLYWPAPGPVPERTELPPGIEPVKSSSDYAQERMRQRAEADQVVYELIAPGSRLRTTGVIGEAAGLTREQVLASLQRLIEAGRVRRNDGSGQYFWVDGPRRRSPQKAEPSPEPALVRERTEESLADRIKALVDELAATDGGVELREEIALLREENAELREKLERIQQAFN